jgi:2-haloacid dehalogenase
MSAPLERASAQTPRHSVRWATFDCYGTLIDWNAGLRSALAGIWPAEDADTLLAAYHELEPAVQSEDPSRAYREVMTDVTRRIATSRALELRPAEEDRVPRTLPSWPPFPEVPAALDELRRRGWHLAALSNTDPDLIAASSGRLGVPFDEIVTASDAGSYKPALGHWRVFFERTRAARDQHVHVAQSVFHDIAPANALGLTTVWINRLGERAGSAPTRELPDLENLPDTLDVLVG